MTGTIVCGVCGTVNVGVFARCIACGQDLGRAVGGDADESDTESREQADVPLSQPGDATGPILPAKPSSNPPSRSRSANAEQASDELESAAYRQTVVEMPRAPDPVTEKVEADLPAPVVAPPKRKSARPAASPVAEGTTEAPRTSRFFARLLLPEGDRRSVEISKRPVLLGSGLDELGLAGDPRVGSAEARLTLTDGRLFVEPAPNAQNVYRRIDREMRLTEGDVVLMGDVAALFTSVDPGGAVDGARQVLGGSANAPCGRLVFLRRDGTAGPVHDLPAGKTVVGRTDGHLNFPNDTRLSRRHALFFASDQGVTVEDMDSRNGTYLRVREKQQLEPEDALRVGSAGLQIRTK